MTTIGSEADDTFDLPVKPRHRGRQGWMIAVVIVVGWSVTKDGIDPTELVNPGGWSQVRAFFSAMFNPDLSRDMLALTVRESAVTVGYALVGTALALLIGSFGGILLTERIWRPIHGPMRRGRVGWLIGRVAFAVPRSMHEVVFGLVLVNILGLNPLVAVLSIGIPFGAVTAKVFADLLDEAPTGPEEVLRASGAGRTTAVLFATVPHAFADLVSYAFYRFECSLRSAAVLGIVGAGGLGFQLALSFQSLRYDQMWTFLWALVLLSGIGDRWSSALRRRRNAVAVEMRSVSKIPALDHGEPSPVQSTQDRALRLSALICAIGVPISIWRLDLDFSSLWAPRARTLSNKIVAESWPPQVGIGGFKELFNDALDTVALAVLSIVIAAVLGSLLASLAKRPNVSLGNAKGPWVVSSFVRLLMLISRSVPPPVWAFVVVFVLFPGLWPGVVALGIYNAGILGRLQAEVIENHDHRPAETLAAMGATTPGALLYATVPALASRFVALSLYRWEVAIRETVIVGVVGAAGLGRRLDEQTSSFDYDGILATVLALLLVTILVDLVSASMRRNLR